MSNAIYAGNWEPQIRETAMNPLKKEL